MKKLLKAVSLTLLFGLSVIALQDFCRKKTHGFSLLKAQSSSQERIRVALSMDEKKELKPILDQSFHFMAKGHQCYAFLSKDGKYVLKLLKWREIEPSFWVKNLPFSWAYRIKEEKERKKKHDFESYRIAYNELKEDTGLIYLHLEKTEDLNTTLCLYDAIQVRHIISADQIEFILQKKAAPFIPYFEENKNDSFKMKSFLSSLCLILQNRLEKKITDSDISFEYNMGVFEEKPLLFDIGNLTRLQDSQPSDLLQTEARLLLRWLKENSPELALYLEKELELVCQQKALL